MKNLRLKPYLDQEAARPDRGRVIMAQYDEETVVIYQAYPPAIAEYAVEHGRLGGPGFSFERATWIKPGFLWMMRRSAWATAPGQERVLAIWLARAAFETILQTAVHSHFTPGTYPARADWQAALAASEVIVQWDPDHDPRGRKLDRRTIQLGLRGGMLRRLAEEWIVALQDITPYVHEQARFARQPDLLLLPAERLYPVADAALARRLGLDKSSLS